jgi:hypothetical protein
VNLGKDKVHRHNANCTKDLFERVNLVNLVTTLGASCARPCSRGLCSFGSAVMLSKVLAPTRNARRNG